MALPATPAEVQKERKFVIISIYENGRFQKPRPGTILTTGMKIVVLRYN